MIINYTLITGATSGLGRATAIELSNYSNLILHGRDSNKLNDLKELCGKKHNHLIWSCDLSAVQDVEASLIELLSHNILINNYVHSAGQIEMTPLRGLVWDRVAEILNVNLVSALLITKILASKKHNKDALKSVVYISSNLSNHGAKAMAAYGASKGALDNMMKCLAVELAPNIRLNSILPGAMHTPMTESIFANSNVVERMTQQYPLGIGQANQVADVIKFLLSAQASWITGQQIVVDGGRTINVSG
jgi:NAD(P)-dependent dehydrogenase (short-subunit alcohol dehydrogenase family)